MPSLPLSTAVPRREFLAAASAALAASCGRTKATAFPGYAYVANRDSRSVAVVDLSAFTVSKRLAFASAPIQVLAHPALPVIYALESNGNLSVIDAATQQVRQTVSVGATATQMQLTPDAAGSALFVLVSADRRVVKLDPNTLRRYQTIELPATPVSMDLARWTARGLVSFGTEKTFALFHQGTGKLELIVDTKQAISQAFFRSNGEHVWVGHKEDRSVASYTVPDGKLVTRLPLSIAPDHFCMSADGGQMFVTGSGLDAVVVVEPYQTQVAGTLMVSHGPGPMAASAAPPYLFVASPETSQVSIVDLETRKTIAIATVGASPSVIQVTPDGQYVLVLNERSGDMAVIRTNRITGGRNKSAALFTMVPVGSMPVSLAVKAA